VVDDFVRSQGMLEVLWSLESNDTRGATRDDVYDNVVGALRPGAIVLMHENRRPTALALPRILETIRAKGLRAVSVPEMMALDPPTPEQREAGIAGCYRET
jgi:peptidoglycan/xylan/chitin deacetylase (PgdA/CDA1 family)